MSILTGLNAAAIGQLSATRLKALTMADIAGLSGEQLAGLTASQTALLGPLQLLGFSKGQIAMLSPTALAGFSTGQLALLAPLNATLTPQQLSALSTGQLAVIAPGVFTDRIKEQMAALTPIQTALSDPAVQSLTVPPSPVPDVPAPPPPSVPENILPRPPAPPVIDIPPPPTPPAPTVSVIEVPVAPPAIDTPIAPEPPSLVPEPPAPMFDPPAPPTSVIDMPVAPTSNTDLPLPPDPPSPVPAPPTPVFDPPAPPAPAPTELATLSEPSLPNPSPAPETPTFAAPANDNAGTLQPVAMSAAQIAALSAEQINSLSPGQLAALGLDYDKMLAILQADALGGMNSREFGALQALAAKLNVADGISVSGYLEQITDNVILGNSANDKWTGGMKTATPLGNLTANSSEGQVNNLIGKWFLGTDLPSSKVRINIAPNFTVTHSIDPDPLYENGVSMWDINQGNLGDCFFLAPLASVAAHNPSAIESMITDNGNGSYGACFVINAKSEYVTVNDALANGGDIFNHGSDDWAGLLEKAYAQLQGGGNVTGNPTGYGNSYTNLANGGSPEAALAAITGAGAIIDYVADGTSWKSYTFNGPSLTVPDSASSAKVMDSASGISNAGLLAQLDADIAAGGYLVLSSNKEAKNASGKITLMADHAMAIYDVDAGTGLLEIYNPWGQATSGYQPWETTFEVSLSELLADGDIISVATNRAAGPILVAPRADMLYPSASAFGAAPAMLGLAGVG